MASSIFRKNSRLANFLGNDGRELITYIAGSIQRILPHVEVKKWDEGEAKKGGASYTSTKRDEIRFTLSFPEQHAERSLTGTVRRRGGARVAKTLDKREHAICVQIVDRVGEMEGELSGRGFAQLSSSTLEALRSTFDETVVARHLRHHFNLEVSVEQIFQALRQLSEQTYENKALVFGCLLGAEPPRKEGASNFPKPFLDSKKYKAMSDGFRTAYKISRSGQVAGFIDLETTGSGKLTEKHYYPDWAAPIARASLSGVCALALTRQGDILVFDKGTLRFSYRFGRWQYWNHSHVIDLLRDKARAQHVPVKSLGRVVGAIYRAALDVSFRRTGGLFVIVHRRGAIHDIVRLGDAIGNSERNPADKSFDLVVGSHKMQSLPRPIAAELASLDGAIVLANSGEILAYGAVLQPKRQGKIHGTEGSRTKAAIGASNYGIAVKVSSDGDISVYYEGKKFISI